MQFTRPEDRRQYVRVEPEKNHPLKAHINGSDFLDILSVSDISEGGIKVNVQHMFKGCAIDNYVSLIIFLPSPVQRNISVKGQIRHITGMSFGVQFLNLSPENRIYIRQYIASRLKDTSWPAKTKYCIFTLFQKLLLRSAFDLRLFRAAEKIG